MLPPLETIKLQDALLDFSDPEHPKEAKWPAADFIIGNPPFLGNRDCDTNWVICTRCNCLACSINEYPAGPTWFVTFLRRRELRFNVPSPIALVCWQPIP